MCKEIKESSAVQTHINTLQTIISRMANNSSNCKTWAITIISALIVLLLGQGKVNNIKITYLPLIMFWCLDSYYMGMERMFRENYKNFIKNIESSNFDYKNVYHIELPEWHHKICFIIKGIFSLSTTPFYLITGFSMYLLSL